MPSSTADPCSSTASNKNPSKLGHLTQQLELRLFGFRRPAPEKAIFREHLALLLRQGCEYVIGKRRVAPAAVYAVATAIYLRTVKGVAHVSHRQLADDAFTSKRTVTAAVGVLQTIGLIRVATSQVRRDSARIALYVAGEKWPAFCRRIRHQPSSAQQLELLPPPAEVRGGVLEGSHHHHDHQQQEAGTNHRLEPPSPPPAAQQQDRPARPNNRLEGLIAAIAARARALGMTFDETDERERFATGVIDIAALQDLADDLEEEGAHHGDVRRHRIRVGLTAGGRCIRCGRQSPAPTEICPGRPRRCQIQALAGTP